MNPRFPHCTAYNIVLYVKNRWYSTNISRRFLLQGHGGIKDVFADFGFRRPTPQVAADSISKSGEECDCSKYNILSIS